MRMLEESERTNDDSFIEGGERWRNANAQNQTNIFTAKTEEEEDKRKDPKIGAKKKTRRRRL